MSTSASGRERISACGGLIQAESTSDRQTCRPWLSSQMMSSALVTPIARKAIWGGGGCRWVGLLVKSGEKHPVIQGGRLAVTCGLTRESETLPPDSHRKSCVFVPVAFIDPNPQRIVGRARERKRCSASLSSAPRKACLASPTFSSTAKHTWRVTNEEKMACDANARNRL